MEKDVQEQRKQLSAASLSATTYSSMESKYARLENEFFNLEDQHNQVVEENEKLKSELADFQRLLLKSTPPNGDGILREDLLRGLQLRHDALGRDMSDQLKKLRDAAPLTPSKRVI